MPCLKPVNKVVLNRKNRIRVLTDLFVSMEFSYAIKMRLRILVSKKKIPLTEVDPKKLDTFLKSILINVQKMSSVIYRAHSFLLSAYL